MKRLQKMNFKNLSKKDDQEFSGEEDNKQVSVLKLDSKM